MIERFSGQYRFLSNFYPSVVWFEGVEYSTVEHAYQAAKILDLNIRKELASILQPGAAKRFARKQKLRPDWDKIKIEIMHNLLQQKFHNKVLKHQLMLTRPQELIEGNTWGDVFWGVCDGKGENNLGKLLMQIRGVQV